MKSVVIRGVEYQNVPSVKIPLASNPSQTADFFDTSDATLNSGDKMLNGVTAYANGVKYTGTIETKTVSDISVSGASVTVPAGYFANATGVVIPNGEVTSPSTISGSSATVSTGTNTLTLSKTVSVTPHVVQIGYVSSGTAGNSNVSLTASVTTKGATTYTPTTSNQTIASGTYLTGVQTIAGSTNLVASNILKNVDIFGVVGTLDMPVISQDQTTKVLSIS